ncbi:uncharacterized protein LY89DRAFT_153727 [Mollisia scopiformis]|uniref:Uncharacterized protein n=1 Tax=Mollisia scopiformis TaxID=149040 RepID=A0A194WYY4_MOLSC|nr:uncharacterized protein LY89DRAFT_153727 [Mollisia scopiformis]KUJ13173.1 hypothetical protein LY89DRAFT_153727 [Mollisia scopiformis]
MLSAVLVGISISRLQDHYRFQQEYSLWLLTAFGFSALQEAQVTYSFIRIWFKEHSGLEVASKVMVIILSLAELSLFILGFIPFANGIVTYLIRGAPIFFLTTCILCCYPALRFSIKTLKYGRDMKTKLILPILTFFQIFQPLLTTVALTCMWRNASSTYFIHWLWILALSGKACICRIVLQSAWNCVDKRWFSTATTSHLENRIIRNASAGESIQSFNLEAGRRYGVGSISEG